MKISEGEINMKKTIMMIMAFTLMVSTVTVSYADTYTVKKDDVLWKIARDNDTSIDAIIDLNTIKDPNMIYTGQVLKLKEEMSKMTNSDKAVALIESLGTTNTEPVAYVNPNKYIQHNLAVADGLEGFGALVAHLSEGTYGKNIRVFQDGDYVIMHNEYDFFGPKVGFDIFRFEEGLIVEHWDNLTPKAALNPSGRSQLDGPTEITDLDKTEDNKALVSAFVKDVLMGAAPEKITDYISTETYLQHNSGVADGLEGLGAAMAALAEAGTPMIYTDNHYVFGQGNFVLTVSEGQFLGEHVSFYDLFRVTNGKIVEHWDVIESIPTEDTWKNSNGKF